MEDYYGYVYLIHCSATDIYYIGAHKWSISKHLIPFGIGLDDYIEMMNSRGLPAFYFDSSYLGSGTALLSDINKYGRKYFYVVDILAVAYSADDLAIEREITSYVWEVPFRGSQGTYECCTHG